MEQILIKEIQPHESEYFDYERAYFLPDNDVNFIINIRVNTMLETSMDDSKVILEQKGKYKITTEKMVIVIELLELFYDLPKEKDNNNLWIIIPIAIIILTMSNFNWIR